MKTFEEIKNILQTHKPFLAQNYGIKEIGMFGSYVRNEQRPDSDLDILIELESPSRIGLMGLANLENYLSELFDMKIDISIKKNLKRRIGEKILNEVVSV